MEALRRLLEKAERDPDILAVFLYGSRARGEAGPGSDTDVCLVLSRRMTREDQAKKLWEYLDPQLDVRLFQGGPVVEAAELQGGQAACRAG